MHRGLVHMHGLLMKSYDFVDYELSNPKFVVFAFQLVEIEFSQVQS